MPCGARNDRTQPDRPSRRRGFPARRASSTRALAGADDGETFIESVRSESFLFDDGRLKSASYDTGQGFGLRVVSGETTGYAHASELSESALRRAATAASAAKRGRGGVLALGPTPTNRRLYDDIDPTASPDFGTKTNLLAEIDAWCRAQDPRVVQVSASLAGSHTTVEIIRSGGASIAEARPARTHQHLGHAREGWPPRNRLCRRRRPRRLRGMDPP